jgi:hypothetical protein
MVYDLSAADNVQISQREIVGKLRANPIASLSKSYSSRSSRPTSTPSPKKSKVEDTSGDTADADPIAKGDFPGWALPADWKGTKEEGAVTKISINASSTIDGNARIVGFRI